MSTSKILASIAVGGLISAAFGLVAELPAYAVSASCSTTLEEHHIVGPNFFDTTVYCTSISGDARVRGNLVRTALPDGHTSWFTTKKKTYVTPEYACPAGCHDSYSVDHV